MKPIPQGDLPLRPQLSLCPPPRFGAHQLQEGFEFVVWAPHAESVSVVGTFNAWNKDAHPLVKDKDGVWSGQAAAKFGDEYRFALRTWSGEVTKIDPYAREVTNSTGNGILHDTRFDWGDDSSPLPAWNELVIYELHIGTFHRKKGEEDTPGTFSEAAAKLSYLKKLGVNAIQIMPVAEFAGDLSWGYNPAHMFAVESAYGGPLALKHFVREAHRQGIAVILDVVYNHFGPSDLELWQFDGWCEHDLGGIYFYNDWKAQTPWGHCRPDYGRNEVREFIRDNALMWLNEYHIDGLRFDATVYIRTVEGPGDKDLPEGWTLLQFVNAEIQKYFPGRITIAEDLQNSEWLTKSTEEGGAGFSSQWDAQFVHPVRQAVIETMDEHRNLDAIQTAICTKYNLDSTDRVIYSESHDEVANGKARVPYEISSEDPTGYFAQKRSFLAAVLMFTSPGIPMLFQGQEFLQGEWFQDSVALDWNQPQDFEGAVRLYRDLISLRLNRANNTLGLIGPQVEIIHRSDAEKIIALRRWDEGDPSRDVVVILNFSNAMINECSLDFPREGIWKLRFNSDWDGYSPENKNCPSADIEAVKEGEGITAKGIFAIGSYSALIYSQG